MCIGSAISALVGAAMGEGDVKAAIKITKVAFIFSIVVLCIVTIILQFTTYDIIKIYTD
jgi:Na+-driven multidrug efflux pump